MEQLYQDKSPYKSRGERYIADFLEDSDIDFQYEYPLAIKDRDQVRIWYPDFTLPEYNMIIEYFGMNRDPGYKQQMAHKLFTYKEAGIDGIYLTESSLSGNWQEQVLGRIEGRLEGKLQKIRSINNRKMYTASART